MKKTKIICTMGPNADKRETLKALVENGMDIARFNFSHGDHEEQKARFDLLKSVRDEMKKPVAILLDTKGPGNSYRASGKRRQGRAEGRRRIYPDLQRDKGQ